jgi:predicted naringenin-chalcone synthase
MSIYEKHAAALCEMAIRNCIAQLNLPMSEITHLVTFSCTGMYAPGLDIQLVQRMGLVNHVERTCINFMGCYAGISALKTANHIAKSDPSAVVLVTGVELCTIHYRKSEDDDQVVANALFGDGAAACIVSSKQTMGQGRIGLRFSNFYSEFDPSGNDEMVWRIGDFGFELRLSSYVPALISKSINALVKKLLLKAGLSKEEIAYYAIHPGGRKILEVCEQALEITKEQNKISYEVLQDYGNMSSVTIFFVLQRLMQNLSSQEKGKKIFSCAFGPGLTMESMIIEVCQGEPVKT